MNLNLWLFGVFLIKYMLCLDIKHEELRQVLSTFDALDLLSTMIEEEIEAHDVVNLDLHTLRVMGVKVGRSRRLLNKIEETSEGNN